MSKLKKWLYERFLPAWCREDLLDANRRLKESLLKERQENDRLRAYIEGLHAVLRRQQKVTICTSPRKEDTV